jgi:cellulose synthase/poly-beta-1,6-N-acetylglucosamine synthase-like glycosyltransferase
MTFSAVLLAILLLTSALVPFLIYLLVITVAAANFRRRGNEGGTTWSGKFFVVIPAHNEAASIGETVTALRSSLGQGSPPFSVWVVADNCSDRTAEIAAQAGARVLERGDPSRRGKGYALSLFFAHLLADPDVRDQDAAVVIDADTSVDPQLLSAFARQLGTGADWLQGVSGIANQQASWRTRLMSCAFALVNGTWLMGQDGLGHSVSLRGNGMCFTVRGLRRIPWQAFGLAEDIEFSWTLRLERNRVRFVPEAKVFSEIVTTNPEAVRIQRQRWELGRKRVRRKFSRLVLNSDALTFWEKIFCLLELHMPTLTSLACLIAMLAGFAWLEVPPKWPGTPVLAVVHLAIIAVFVSYVTSSFWLRLLPLRYAFYLLYSPLYMLWKFDLLFRRSPTLWIRTAREGESR